MPGIKLYARAGAKLPPGAPDLAVDSGGAADRSNA
jgi:hypothetical protein